MTMPECANHPGVQAAQSCDDCSRPFCEACLVEFHGRVRCAACKLAELRRLSAPRITRPNDAREAFTLALVGIMCFGVVLEPWAVIKACRALADHADDPEWRGRGTAISALVVAFLVILAYLGLLVMNVWSLPLSVGVVPPRPAIKAPSPGGQPSGR